MLLSSQIENKWDFCQLFKDITYCIYETRHLKSDRQDKTDALSWLGEYETWTVKATPSSEKWVL